MTREERLELAKKRMATDETQGVTSQRRGAFTIPEGAKMYKIREGRNLISIIPYEITNPKNPVCKLGYKVGDEDYVQIYHVHNNIGTNKNTYLCNAKMYGGRCPICDVQRTMWDTDREGAKKLYPKDRVIYNVIDRLDPDAGIQLFEGSYYWIEKPLKELSALKATDGMPILYGDREIGMDIEFFGVKTTYENHEFLKPDHFNFVPREIAIDESMVKIAYPIDSIFNIPNYKEVENDYYGIYEEDDVSEAETYTPPQNNFNNAVAQDAHTIGKTVADSASLEDMIASEAPKSHRRREKACAVTCPYGHTCGADFDATDDCTKCDNAIYDKCGDIHDAM